MLTYNTSCMSIQNRRICDITQRNATHRNSTYFRCRAYESYVQKKCCVVHVKWHLPAVCTPTLVYPDWLASDMIATA